MDELSSATKSDLGFAWALAAESERFNAFPPKEDPASYMSPRDVPPLPNARSDDAISNEIVDIFEDIEDRRSSAYFSVRSRLTFRSSLSFSTRRISVITTSTGRYSLEGATWSGAYTKTMNTGFGAGAPRTEKFQGVREGREKGGFLPRIRGIGRTGKAPATVSPGMVAAARAGGEGAAPDKDREYRYGQVRMKMWAAQTLLEIDPFLHSHHGPLSDIRDKLSVYVKSGAEASLVPLPSSNKKAEELLAACTSIWNAKVYLDELLRWDDIWTEKQGQELRAQFGAVIEKKLKDVKAEIMRREIAEEAVEAHFRVNRHVERQSEPAPSLAVTSAETEIDGI